MESIVRSVESSRDIYFGACRRTLYGSAGEREAARLCLKAGFDHPGVFKDAWTLPSNDPYVLFYIRTPLGNEECDDGQFLRTDSNGPVTKMGGVEVGAARITGTHRVISYVETLEHALIIARNGVVQPQVGDDNWNDPNYPLAVSMESLLAPAQKSSEPGRQPRRRGM